MCRSENKITEELSSPRRSQNAARGITSRDLDELRPQLMVGALFAMLKTTRRSFCIILPVFVSWRVIVFIIVGYVLSLRFAPLITLGAHTGTLIIYLMVEAFFFFRSRKKHKRLQCIRQVEERPLPPSGALDLFNRVLVTVESCASWKASHGIGRLAEKWLEMWFLGTPIAEIPRDNLREFYAWAFFTRQPKELDAQQEEMMNSFIVECERRFHWNFKPGYDAQIKAIRINFDPIKVWYHPLSYYACVWALLYGSRQYMRVLGFTHSYGSGGLPFFHKGPPDKPGVLITDGAVAPHEKKIPIIFIHGLGPGIAPYLRFLRRLAASYECFVIELPDISQAGVEKSLAFQEMANALATMLEAHGHTKACFIGHSFGTFVMAWVSRWRPDIVEKALFLDPVCFLLSQPDVAFNVLYRQPRNWFTHLAANAVFWELYTANSLHRNFIWYNNVLWLDELPKKSMIALSGMDDIANAGVVRCFIEEHQRQAEGDYDELNLLWYDSYFHGEIFLHKSAELQIMDFI